MPQVQLRAMSDDEFASYRVLAITGHAQDSIRAGRWPAHDARQRAEQQFDDLLSSGLATEGMLLLSADDDLGRPVGMLWLGLAHPGDIDGTGYLYDIEVLPHRRGLGFGRSLLVAGEDLLRARGLQAVGLSVFGPNETARRLYATNGYQTVSQQMRKSL